MDNKNKITSEFGNEESVLKKKDNKKDYIQAIVIIGLSLFFVFAVMVSIQSVMGKETFSITTNTAEQYYYAGKYDNAIAEYIKMQEKEDWPIYKVKAAEIYSLNGKFNESNNLLKEAMILKDKLVAEDEETYLEKDKELVNEVIFTFFMNGENDQALSLGEYYLEVYNDYKPLLKTMFTVYMANNKNTYAKEIVEAYPVDRDSAYDLSILAEMQFILGNVNEGINTLKEAYYNDANEIKVSDVIEQAVIFDKNDLLSELEFLNEKNPEEALNMFIAKIYSMDEETKEIANEILNDSLNKVNNINCDLIKISIDISENNKSKLKKLVKELSETEDDSYIASYLTAIDYYNDGDYNKAFEKANESIVENRNYPNSYGILIPNIMNALGTLDNVDAYIRTALEKEPFNYYIMLKSGDYYADVVANYTKAEEYYNLAKPFVSKTDEIYYKLAMLDVHQEKFEDAIVDLEEAINVNSENENYYRALGTIYFNENDNEKALEFIRKAFMVNENDVLTLNNAACYYMIVEEDVWRAYANIESAYDDMPKELDEKTKATIIDNYNKIKKVYDVVANDSGAVITVPTLELVY